MSGRAVLSFCRDLEFATATELAKRMGCHQSRWLRATIKELVDNGLDACEEAGIATPWITITVAGNEIAIGDNGPGMSPELVERLCVRSERTSTREAYAAPDRGSQGNALATIMALPFGLGRDEAGLTITSQGLKHDITLRVNRLDQRIDLERTTTEVATSAGTIISMNWPAQIDVDDLEELITQHAWLNPHAEFQFDECEIKTTAANIEKWTSGLPIPPHWYSAERFAHRILLEIKRDPEITVGQFLTSFKGLTSSSKRSEVAARADLSYQPLKALLDATGTDLDHGRVRTLLEAMQAVSRAPKHAVLGAVGKEAVEAWVRNHDCTAGAEPRFFAYTTADGVIAGTGIPYRWEIGFAHLPEAEERQILVGQNFSPAISPIEMINGVLPYCSSYFGSRERIALFLHRITPARQTLDYGKSRLEIAFGERAKVEQALEKIAKPWIKYRKAQDRGRHPILPNEPKPERVTFKDACFRVMAESYDTASSGGKYPIISQQVFYKARPKVLELTGKDGLSVEERARFCYTLLPQFIQDHPGNWRIIYKPRGDLIEPHTKRKIGLGTVEVANYHTGWTNGVTLGETSLAVPEWKVETSGPHHRYGAVIIVEKGGIADVLRQAGIDDRHDVAIIGNEGQSVEAELRLADAFGDADVPIFLLTDFDRQGFTIAENLRSGTWRHQYRNRVRVIHIGLRLDQIEDFGGLEDEPIGEGTLKHVGDDRLRQCGATEVEIDRLKTRRVELNALTTEQLVELVEKALAEHNVQKVIPDAEGLAEAWRAAKARAEIAEAVEKANQRADRWRRADVPDDLLERVHDLLDRDPALSWDVAVRTIAEAAP